MGRGGEGPSVASRRCWVAGESGRGGMAAGRCRPLRTRPPSAMAAALRGGKAFPAHVAGLCPCPLLFGICPGPVPQHAGRYGLRDQSPQLRSPGQSPYPRLCRPLSRRYQTRKMSVKGGVRMGRAGQATGRPHAGSRVAAVSVAQRNLCKTKRGACRGSRLGKAPPHHGPSGRPHSPALMGTHGHEWGQKVQWFRGSPGTWEEASLLRGDALWAV